jgi:hypothetical protein
MKAQGSEQQKAEGEKEKTSRQTGLNERRNSLIISIIPVRQRLFSAFATGELGPYMMQHPEDCCASWFAGRRSCLLSAAF